MLEPAVRENIPVLLVLVMELVTHLAEVVEVKLFTLLVLLAGNLQADLEAPTTLIMKCCNLTVSLKVPPTMFSALPSASLVSCS